MNKTLICLSILTLSSASALAEQHRHHGAHEHGAAQLNLVLDGKLGQLEVNSPAANILGFEHKPKNTEQKKSVKTAKAKLNSPETLFVFNPEAQCRFTEVKLESDLFEDKHGHDHDDHHKDAHDDHHKDDHDDHHEDEHDDHHKDDHESDHKHSDHSDHSDIHARYSFHCEQPDKLKTINMALLTEFPLTHELRIQAILDNRQLSKEVTQKNTLFTW